MKEIETEKLLEKINDPSKYPIVVHGTYKKFWELIEKEGLKRMTRLHMHFAPGYPKEEGVISGMRSSCDVIV
jgi:RNA:NAD 2'-phosphotransferase (TPT1/KptA family)